MDTILSRKIYKKDRFKFPSIGDTFSTRIYFQTGRLPIQNNLPRWSSLFYTLIMYL